MSHRRIYWVVVFMVYACLLTSAKCNFIATQTKEIYKIIIALLKLYLIIQVFLWVFWAAHLLSTSELVSIHWVWLMEFSFGLFQNSVAPFVKIYFDRFIKLLLLLRETKILGTAKYPVISPNFLVWKICGKAQFWHSSGRFARNYAETVPFRKMSTPEN